ncbi:Transposase family Tnp2 protein [Ceratobasidium sp. AG-Ba]|nr:Transposase family Tnp2 protein [Ceratobasidium sp. AG-Ba]
MDSDSSGSDSDFSNDEYGYRNLDSDTHDKPAADGKVDCTCGCGTRRSCRTKRRHLKKLRERIRLNQVVQGQEYQDAVPMDVDQELEMEDVNQEELPMHYHHEEEWERSPSPTDDWHSIATPPPSPPPFDPDPPSEDEDGYVNIDAEDYREYDRWFAEDLEPELDEFVRETITEQELDSIKMAAIRQFGHISQRNYERIRYSFRDKVFLMTLQCFGTRIAKLSGVKPEDYDCCINVCHAFIGRFADEDKCSTCGALRYDELGRPRQSYQYIPTTGRFLAMFNNPSFIEKLEYRHNYEQREGRIDDVFDGQLYKNLCQQNIAIEGEDIGVKYFSGKYDIATSLLADGVQIFKQETATCWPIILQILNLPPRDRVQMRNVMPLCVIPGPNQPKDFNSFLEPFVLECQKMARGVEAFNTRTGRPFILRHHPILVGGDMQAIKHLEEMKGVGGKLPCRGCESEAIYHRNKRTYYLPLAEPLDPDNPAARTSSYDPLNLPTRTEAGMKRQTQKMLNAETPREYEKLGTKYGISGPTILDRIPSLKRPTSYPHEFLHLFLLNHFRDLVSLWSSTDPAITDDGCEDYLISPADWAEIGRETEAASASIPSYFTRPLPNINTQRRLYCGESWAFWLLYIGPIVLRNRLADKYYNHFLELVSIVKCLIQFENSTERIEQLREEMAGYVERYEDNFRYYYQYNYDRISVCKLTLHALLHVADDVLLCGPVWTTWSYLTERYCREVIACARQRVVPSATIAKFVLQLSQLSAVAMRFPEVRKALLFGKSDAPVDTSSMECVYTDYPDAILRVPCLAGFVMQPRVRRRVAAFLRTNFCLARSHHEWMQFLPERCERWGKLRIGNGGDCIRTACTRNPSSAYGKRDNSFIRYTFRYDKNARNGRPAEMLDETGYGRLDFILAITLPANPRFNIESPQLHVLAHITQAEGAIGDASTQLVSYTKMGRSFVLDITSVECAVGRVETRAKKPNGEWVIVDRSEGLCQTAFHQEEQEFEEEG